VPKNFQRRYLHLFPFMVDHNENHCGHHFVVDKRATVSKVFPSKKIDLVKERRFNPCKNYPRTVTSKCRCSGQHHEITYGLDGSIILHAHDNVEELRTMALWTGEKPRCLEIYDAWMQCTNFKKVDHHGDYVLQENRKILPPAARQTLNWLYKRKSYAASGEVYSEQIRKARSRYTYQVRVGVEKSFDIKVKEFRYEKVVEYFGNTALLASFLGLYSRSRYSNTLEKNSWFSLVRGNKLHELVLINENFSQPGKILHATKLDENTIVGVVGFVQLDDKRNVVAHKILSGLFQRHPIGFDSGYKWWLTKWL